MPGPKPADMRTAVALRYSQGDASPRVVARGRGETAAEIMRRAREAGLYVHESPALVALLMRVDLDRHIPPALYHAVAEVLVWAWKLDREAAQQRSPK
ncbi:flagellar biosynthesis protein [Betaproteobacteria bacterium GR16-43]|nr:flagellar biosynthesis protein [Betaproteobacteria bacterium GR16-43]